VRLAALNLREISGWVWVVSARIGYFRESQVFIKFTGFSLSLNVTFLCKLRRIRDPWNLGDFNCFQRLRICHFRST